MSRSPSVGQGALRLRQGVAAAAGRRSYRWRAYSSFWRLGGLRRRVPLSAAFLLAQRCLPFEIVDLTPAGREDRQQLGLVMGHARVRRGATDENAPPAFFGRCSKNTNGVFQACMPPKNFFAEGTYHRLW